MTASIGTHEWLVERIEVLPLDDEVLPIGVDDPDEEIREWGELKPTAMDMLRLDETSPVVPRDTARAVTSAAKLATRTVMMQVAYPNAHHPYEWPL